MTDIVVVGGGIVGLATAWRILQQRPRTRLVLIEKELSLGAHQTSNNSGVIHSGLYYRPGSLKATACRRGYYQLIQFCRNENIPFELCGKMVVATRTNELPALEELHRRGCLNGLSGLRWLSESEIREIEPHCAGIKGLFVPQTGIVSYSAVAQQLACRVRDAGGVLSVGERVSSISRSGASVRVESSRALHHCSIVITCAGLHSDRLARQTQPDLSVRIIPFRGEYYALKPSARGLVRNLIYPVANPTFPFLGVHFTRLIDGSVECGPNAVFAFGREAYKKTDFSLRDTAEAIAWPGFRTLVRTHWRTGLAEYRRSISKAAFVRALQRLIPDLCEEDIEPGGAGVRAQACSRDGRLLDDFHIEDQGNVIHVCNAPSPAATASLAIGDTIAQMALSRLN